MIDFGAFFLVFYIFSFIAELLTRTVSDAHKHTCLLNAEQIVNIMQKPADLSRIVFFKNLVSSRLFEYTLLQ